MFLRDTDAFSITSPTSGLQAAEADRIRRWLASAETAHRERILPVTTAIAHCAGEMLCRAVMSGSRPSSEDAFIAATATVHGLTVISRNGRDMAALGARWSDPLALGVAR